MNDKKKIGSPIGPRPVYWHGVSIKDNKLIHCLLSSKNTGINPDKFYKEKATVIFKEKFGVDPLIVEGPFRNAILAPKKAQVKGKFNETAMVFTGEQKEAVFKGWDGIAHFVKDDKDNEAALFLFESEQNPEKGRTKAKPKAKIVPISMLEFLSMC